MRTRRILSLALAGSFLATLAFGYRLQSQLTATVPVLVAARDLPAGYLLTEQDLRPVRVSPALTPPDAAKQPGDAVGKYTRTPLLAGDLVRPERLNTTPPPRSLAERLHPGMRALSVSVVPGQVLGGALRPGDQVDLLFAPHPESRGETVTAATLLKQATVLDIRNQAAQPAVRDTTDPAAASTQGNTSLVGRAATVTLTNMGDGPIPATVLLEVTPEEAASVVARLAEGGQVYLTLVGKQSAGDAP